MSAPLDNLETQLEMCIENICHIGKSASKFQQGQGQNVLNQKIQGLAGGLKEIDKLRNQVQDVFVPIEVLQYIDDEKDPMNYSYDCLEKTADKNEEAKGKNEGLRKFKTNLLIELFRELPNEMRTFRVDRPDCIPK